MREGAKHDAFWRATVLLLYALTASVAGAAEYQFRFTMPASAENKLAPRQSNFFLYIPPEIQRVRAVLWAPANITERRLADDPSLHEEAARVRNEWWPGTVQRLGAVRAAVPQALTSAMLDRDHGHGHVGRGASMTEYLVLFLRKAFTARLADDGTLRAVDFAGGWLGEPTNKAAIAPERAYTGDLAKTFWFFDKQQAVAWQTLFLPDVDKQHPMLAFVQDGETAPCWHGWALSTASAI